MNGDGFGVAWYCDDEPDDNRICIFKSPGPVWSDMNIMNIGRFTKSTVILGHVRAAASGHNPLEPVIVNYQNCHPFKYGRYTFMHNGGIPHFEKIKRKLSNYLEFGCYQRISGTTDSEHVFALFLSLLSNRDSQISACDIAKTLNQTINMILRLCDECGVEGGCSFNFVVTDGVHVVATRFRSSDGQPPSLYYNFGSKFCPRYGNFTCERSQSVPGGVIITSNPLNKDGLGLDGIDDGTSSQWWLIPTNHMLVCVGDESNLTIVKNYRIVPIEMRSEEVVPPHLQPSVEKAASHASLDNGLAVVAVVKNGNGTTTVLKGDMSLLNKKTSVQKKSKSSLTIKKRGIVSANPVASNAINQKAPARVAKRRKLVSSIP